jgi:hypothetical protein
MILFSFTSIIYLFYPNFALTNEDMAVGQAQNLANKIELYKLTDNFYPYHTHLYGPLLALVQYISLKMPFSLFFNCKLFFILAYFLFILFMFFSYKIYQKNNISYNKELIKLKFLSINYFIVLIVFSNLVYSAKAEPFLLFLVSLTIFISIYVKNSIFYSILIGCLSGIAISFKIHAFLYILIAIFSSNEFLKINIKMLLLVLISSLSIIFLPFIHPNISFNSYMLTLSVISKHGLSLALFIRSIFVVIFLLSPIIILLVYLHFQNKKLNPLLYRNLIILFLLEILLTIVNSKPGIYVHHFIPIIPANAFLLFILLKNVDIIDFKNKLYKFYLISNQSLYITISFMCVINIFFIYYSFIEYWPKTTQARAEILYLNNKYKDAVMGITDDRALYLYFNRLYLNNTQIDLNGYLDLNYSDIDDSELRNKIRTCSITYFIFPKNNVPFSFQSLYTNKYLFSKEVRQLFSKKYSLVESSDSYNVFKCFRGQNSL